MTFQIILDPQTKSLLKMNEVIEIMMREERQILDLQLETKREEFKMKKVKSPKLFPGNLYI